MSDSPTGLYRSDRILVIDRKSHRSPDRCVWSGDAVTVAHTEMTVCLMLPIGGRRGSVGQLVRAASAYVNRLTCTLNVPVCSRCAAKLKRWIKILLIATVGTWAIATAPLTWLIRTSPQINDINSLPALVGIATLGLFVVGLITLFVALGIILKDKDYPVAHIDENHVWIAGVHPSFLARLPEWSGERFQELRNRRGF